MSQQVGRVQRSTLLSAWSIHLSSYQCASQLWLTCNCDISQLYGSSDNRWATKTAHWNKYIVLISTSRHPVLFSSISFHLLSYFSFCRCLLILYCVLFCSLGDWVSENELINHWSEIILSNSDDSQWLHLCTLIMSDLCSYVRAATITRHPNIKKKRCRC